MSAFWLCQSSEFALNCLLFFQRQLRLEPLPTCINCTAYNHNGTLCISGGADGMIRLFGKSLRRKVEALNLFTTVSL